jgi:hypothetical protein
MEESTEDPDVAAENFNVILFLFRIKEIKGSKRNPKALIT